MFFAVHRMMEGQRQNGEGLGWLAFVHRTFEEVDAVRKDVEKIQTDVELMKDKLKEIHDILLEKASSSTRRSF